MTFYVLYGLKQSNSTKKQTKTYMNFHVLYGLKKTK